MSLARAYFFLLIALSCVAVFPTFVRAQSASDIQAQIDENSRQIEALQAEIASFQKELDALGAKKNTLQSAIGSLTLSQKKLASEIKVTQSKIASANLKIKELTFSIGDKEESISENQSAIAKALRSIAEDEQIPLVARLISSDSLREAWQTADYAIQFNHALADDIRELRTVRTELAENRDAVSATKESLVVLQNDLSLQKKSVELQKSAQQKLLSDTKNQESAYQKIVSDKRAEEAAFEASLFELESRLQYVLDPNRIPPSGSGILRWPLSDVFITQQFGKTSSSQRLYASGTHNGVDFRARIGTPVRAALSGTVMAINQGSVRNCQYGKWVLIKHQNGLATLYAHLSDISVQNGAVVSTGQVIGFAGDTGYAIGPHLHFTVYIAEAVSFKQYSCWNKSFVTIPIAPINAYLNPLSYL
ncbi:MAG: peptidoglycan DD-metalloendopeptidase family protein [Patescibacteria group bacterium]